MINQKAWTAISLLLVIIFSLMIRLPYLNVPLERDEGGYAYIAWRMEQGELPYKDIYDNKPPGIYYIYSIILKLFGNTPRGIHFFMYLWVLLEILLIYKLSSVLFNNKTIGILSATVFSFVISEPGVFGSAANTEIFMLLPVIASYVVLLWPRGSGTRKVYFICGLLQGIAFMIKPVSTFNLLGILCYLLYKAKANKQYRAFFKQVLESILGFIVVPLLFIIYFWYRGAAEDFLYWAFGYNLDYMSVGGPILSKEVLSSFWRRFSFILKGDILFWVFCFYAFVLFINKSKEIVILLMIWLAVSFFGVASGKRFFPHYFIQIMPPLAIGAAWGIWHLLCEQLRSMKNAGLRRLLTYSLVVGIIILPVKANYKYLLSYTPDQISERIYTVNPFVEARQIASYLAEQTLPTDTIAILGSEPEIICYAQRKSATKYIYFHHILWRKTPAAVLEAQKEAVAEIENNDPRYIVAVNINASVGKTNDTPEYLFIKMRQIIKDRYYLDGFVNMKRESTSYVLGKEQVDKNSKLLNIEQPQIMIYKRKGV